MGPGPVTVTEAVGRRELARFVELPRALAGDDERFAPPIVAWERYRVDARRNPYFEDGEAGLFLARRDGRLVGRIAAHRPGSEGPARFGFWWVADDRAVAEALLDAARTWTAERGGTSMSGPLSFEADDEPGVLVEGFDAPGRTGLPWHPDWQHRLLEEAGATLVERRPSWALELEAATRSSGPAPRGAAGSTPPQAGGYGDPALVVAGAAAVPDVAAGLRSSHLRGAWALARRARDRSWDDAVVVAWDGDDGAAAALVSAAAAAGYRRLHAPWSPDPAAPPAVVHARYELRW